MSTTAVCVSAAAAAATAPRSTSTSREDEELSAPPPPYSTAISHSARPLIVTTKSNNYITYMPTSGLQHLPGCISIRLPPQVNLCGPASIQRNQSISNPPAYTNYRFPKEFGFYHASNAPGDFAIAFHADDPYILFYISTHSDSSAQPSIILHSVPNSAAPPLATASFHGLSDTVAINLFDNPGSIVKAQSADTSESSMMFLVPLPGSGLQEQFEWRSSQGMEVAMLDGRSNGMKLVRCSTGEVVAAWTRPHIGLKKLGKMSFLATDRTRLGERFELMAVITILAIMEKDIRRKSGIFHYGSKY